MAVKKCICCLKERELTNEHVILKALGGGFAPKLLCKDCNSRFGSGLDANFRDQIQNRIACYAEAIRGRGKRVQGPFEGVPGEISGTGIPIVGARDFDFKVVQDARIALGNNELRIDGAFSDGVSLEYVRGVLGERLKNELRVKCQNWAEVEIDKFVAGVLEKLSEKDLKRVPCDGVVFHDIINLGELELAFEKIAYELACVELGDEYFVRSANAKILRDEILAHDSKARHHCGLFPKIPIVSEILKYLNSKKLHAVIMFGDIACIQIFGMTSMVPYEEKSSRFSRGVLESTLHTFDYNGKYAMYNFANWLDEEQGRSCEVAKILHQVDNWMAILQCCADSAVNEH